MSLLFLDVDHFKKVNDTLGHAAGDAVLCAVAERLQEVLRDDDTAARLGGDEFAILLEDTSALEAAEVAQRILEAVRRPVECAGRVVTTGVSIGVAERGVDTDAGTLLRHADLAMYAAKRAGRGRVEVFQPAMQARMVDQVSMEEDLRGAVQRGEMSLVYQPVVCLRTGVVYGAEALLRWHHPQRGDVSPARFIRVAEESGLIDELGRWVLAKACRQAAAWQPSGGRGQPLQMAVNLSPRQLADTGLVDAVRAALADNGLHPAALVLEITESALMGESMDAAQVLERLHGLGVGLSLDDFGTGYSSLGRLRAFPFTMVKIDQTFVGEIDSGTTAVVEAALALAGSLGLDTVGEGIETRTQLAALQERGCVGGQGHLFSPPVPAEEFTTLLERSRTGQLQLLPGLRRVASAAG